MNSLAQQKNQAAYQKLPIWNYTFIIQRSHPFMKMMKSITPPKSTSLKATNSTSVALRQLVTSAEAGELVIVAGAGVSASLSNGSMPSWTALIESGLNYCEEKGRINKSQSENWKSHLVSDDLDELLGAAEFMSRKLDAPKGTLYVRWLQQSVQKGKPTNDSMIEAIRTLCSAGARICTLNYDTLLETVTGMQPIIMSDTLGVTEWMRGTRTGIVHLHGYWEVPESCILSIRDYQTTIGDDVRDLIQRGLGSFKRLLFVGCGSTLDDPNFSALIQWLRINMAGASLQHFALVREDAVAAFHKNPSLHGFVEPLSFGASFSDLPKFLTSTFPSQISKGIVVGSAVALVSDQRVLDNYRRFLVKDCGQMTIEGVKADMDTTKQKFDIEKLFVPLSVLPCAPDFPENDPDRDEKLSLWIAANREPIRFGMALATNQRLALLALPGGGKTMLLKRLAVAYADPERRKISSDDLPNQDYFPVLIRCREWRDHIQSPILTLLKNLPDITGQANLEGLADALLSLLQTEKVLLLVDGLDEIHSDVDRATFVENLEKFLEDFPSTRLVVTSREAGFSLIAPCLNRFCERFRVAPLDPIAIELLCHHWHLLMGAGSPEALAEGRALAHHMVNTTALRRLAENPLLLTMLLVVKHGAGRLPPDRVSLYSRAVEVLLDTWNIKGHAALNLKEAIPQLACVAFELMRKGKQTATESELLSLLEEARIRLPQIGRYAKDSPHEFLKRVELRSSLLLEAGHQVEAGRAVPFYQFRHLTFQEYLAAVAAANGHFIGYQTGNTVLTPLQPFVIAEEWKEVVPMAAVLAAKQADPLIGELVAEAKTLQRLFMNGDDFPGKAAWLDHPAKLPAPISRLTQCLVEEAEVSQEMLPDALQLVAIFAHGCRSDDDWKGLVRGPYGDELTHQAWKLFQSHQLPWSSWIRNTCAALGAHRQNATYWASKLGKAHLRGMIRSTSQESVSMGLLTCVGAMFAVEPSKRVATLPLPRREFQKLLFRDERAIWHAATWIFALERAYSTKLETPDESILNRLILLWEKEENEFFEERIVDFAIAQLAGLRRESWIPKLTESQRALVLRCLDIKPRTANKKNNPRVAACIIAFHAKDIVSDSILAKAIVSAKARSTNREFKFVQMLNQMGKIGQKYVPTKVDG